MRINPRHKTESQYRQGFIGGIVTAIILGVSAIAGKRVLTWLSSSPLQSVYHWATTEQMITYVPVDTFFSLFGVFFIVLVLFVVVGYMMSMTGLRVRT